MSDRQRFDTHTRHELILRAAIEVARQPGGWGTITRFQIAREGKCSEGLVSKYLGDMVAVRKAIIKVAIKEEIVEIVAQSVAARDGYTARIPTGLHRKAVNSLLR